LHALVVCGLNLAFYLPHLHIHQLQLHVGCSGWNHDAWQGRFYPHRLQSSRWLQHYSSAFDYVEVDSTFYRIPRREMSLRWASTTPPHFQFTAKFPQVVTHDTRLGGGLDGLKQFFEFVKPLQSKLLCLLIQLPPSLAKDEGLPKLERLIPNLWKKYRYAIEVRHKSWLTKEVYSLLSENNICITWSQLDAIQTPPELTTDFFYLRFIGDKSADKKDFDRIQKDREKEMQRWAKIVKNSMDSVRFGIVAADNHYAGFAPATANSFKKMAGLAEV
jgi:uncharacterized protein YecE (DUF72 family)